MMRKTALSLILLLMLTTCCTNRRSQHERILADIDSLTETDADSARRMLMDMSDEMEEAPEGIRAYYDLLTVKADDKAKQKHTSDSLICEVASYFEKHPKTGHLPEAYYYVGRVNVDTQNGEKALLYFQKALLEDSIHVTTRLKSRIYAQLGYIYLRNGLFEEAIGMQQLANFYCRQIGDTLGMRYTTEDIQTINALMKDSTIKKMPKTETMIQVQKLNSQVKSQILRDRNARLQQEQAEERTIVWISISIATFLLIVGAFVLYKRKNATSASTDKTQPPLTKRQFYDKDISEMLTTHLYNNKVLKTADWKLIEERLLRTFPTFRDSLYSLYSLSETEYHICMLIKLEVSPSNMAKLMATGTSTISQSRLRMQQKVFNGQGTAKDWDNYVLSL
jgi:tetratricopeptide (TPR) repeat protein